MSRRFVLLTVVVVAVLGARPAVAQSYAMVELMSPTGSATTVLGSSEAPTTSPLRAVGYYDTPGNVWQGTVTCAGSNQACYWDVSSVAGPVVAIDLPVEVPANPSVARGASADGSIIVGDEWDHDLSSSQCGMILRAVVWENVGGAWRRTVLPAPPGVNRSSATNVRVLSDGTLRIVGSAGTPMPPMNSRYQVVAWDRAPGQSRFTWTSLSDAGGPSSVPLLPFVRLGPTGTLAAGAEDPDPADGVNSLRPVFWQDASEDWAEGVLPCLADALSGEAAPGAYSAFVGWCESTSAGGATHAVAWGTADTAVPPADLGTLGGANSRAWDQNSSGVIVGFAELRGGMASPERAVTWTPTGSPGAWQILDLNTVANTGGWTLARAQAIDEAGRIIGRADSTVQGAPVSTSFALVPQ